MLQTSSVTVLEFHRLKRSSHKVKVSLRSSKVTVEGRFGMRVSTFQDKSEGLDKMI